MMTTGEDPMSLVSSNSTRRYWNYKHKTYEFCHPVSVKSMYFYGWVKDLEVG